MCYRRNPTCRLHQHLALELLEDRLALAGAIHGTLWNDLTIDGVRGTSEPGLAGRTVFLDQNQNQVLDAEELFTTTDAGGTYQFDNLAAGTYHVAQVIPAGWHQAWPLLGSRTVTLSELQQTRFDFERYISPTDRSLPAFREAGFVFDTSVPLATKFHIDAPAVVNSYGGSTSLSSQWTPSTLSLRKEDGGAFSLLTIDLCELSRTAGPATLTFTGRKVDGSQVVQSAALDGAWGFETVAFAGFNDVVEVTWVSSSTSPHQFDNVLVQTTPFVAEGVDLGSIRSLLPALTVFDVSVQEPAAGQADAVFELALSRPHTSPLVIQYSTAAGDAAAGLDYVAQSNRRATFLAGQTRLHVTVQVLADALDEPSEVFFLRVESAVGTSPVRSFGAATIVANRPPSARDDAYAVAEDQMLVASVAEGVLANDSDPDDDPLSAVLVAGPQHGTLEFNSTGEFTYTPQANFFGIDSFAYRARDGEFESSLATVTIVVAPVNDRPLAFSQGVRVSEDGEVPIVLAGSDVETPFELVYAVVALPTNGTLFHDGQVVQQGDWFAMPPTLVYRPGASVDEPSADSFQFVVRDAGSPAEASLPAVVSIETDKAIGDGQIALDAAGVLRIGGTTGNDRIHIHATRAGDKQQLVVRLNGQRASFLVSMVQEVRAWGRAGNDHITMPNVALAGQFFGGSGNDTLHGGFANDLLFGGSGQDWIIGGQGDDLLVGGAGHDLLTGNQGNDLLIGGDVLGPKTLGELSQLSALWSSGASFDFASLVGSDDAFDILMGGRGRDLVFASLQDFHERAASRGNLLCR